MTRFVHLTGDADYAAVHALQVRLVAEVAAGRTDDTVLLLEHPPVITVGRGRGAASNVVAPEGVQIVAVERGGDVTWHGPGQLVAYPIVALHGRRRDLHLHLHSLEDAVIAELTARGLAAGRDPRNTGVWLPHPAGPPRKVCAVGIACRRWVTWHGLALNVRTPLADFARIRPCGFDPDTVTRLADHLDPVPTVVDLVEPLAARLAAALELDPGPVVRWPASRLDQLGSARSTGPDG